MGGSAQALPGSSARGVSGQEAGKQVNIRELTRARADKGLQECQHGVGQLADGLGRQRPL